MDLSDLSRPDYQESLRQQTALAKFGEFALKSNDLDEILTEACRLVGDALDTDLAKVTELRENGTTLLVRVGIGWKPGVVGVITIDAVASSSEGYALSTGEPMISPDIETETRFSYPAFLVEHGVRAVANVVIIGGQDRPPFGLLQVDSRTPRHFTDRDTEFLRGYANLLASAVDRLRALTSLRDEHARMRVVLNRHDQARETGLIGFFEWHVPTNTITGDRQFAEFYRFDPEAAAAGVPIGAILARLPPDERGAADANISRSSAAPTDFVREFRLLSPDRGMRWLIARGHCYEHVDGRPVRYTGTAVDITASKMAEEALLRSNEALEERVAERTRELVAANAELLTLAAERNQVEEALRQAHKMEAVGQLTGGLAHDFNNLLAGITGSLELIRRRVAQGRTGELERYIETALASSDRAAALTHRLLAFSRRQTLDPRPTDINGLIRGIDELFRRTVGPSIHIETRLTDGLWLSSCDPNQVENALLNIVINARDAMPDGGDLVIATANLTSLDRRNRLGAGSPVDLPPGEYVALVVTDTGVGMPADVLTRAFDPFFTTKPLGQGTGLGLSMVYGFVRQTGGHIWLDSTEGKGTTVMIYLPRHVGAALVAGDDDNAPELPVATRAVVLVVEDEPPVRMVVVDVLEDRGYTVLQAADGRSAMDILESGTRVDLLVTDVGLPGGMNGRQLADAARERRRGLKVLFITGYAEGANVANGGLDYRMQVMTKPFGVDALAARVQQMIDA